MYRRGPEAWIFLAAFSYSAQVAGGARGRASRRPPCCRTSPSGRCPRARRRPGRRGSPRSRPLPGSRPSRGRRTRRRPAAPPGRRSWAASVLGDTQPRHLQQGRHRRDPARCAHHPYRLGDRHVLPRQRTRHQRQPDEEGRRRQRGNLLRGPRQHPGHQVRRRRRRGQHGQDGGPLRHPLLDPLDAAPGAEQSQLRLHVRDLDAADPRRHPRQHRLGHRGRRHRAPPHRGRPRRVQQGRRLPRA